MKFLVGFILVMCIFKAGMALPQEIGKFRKSPLFSQKLAEQNFLESSKGDFSIVS